MLKKTNFKTEIAPCVLVFGPRLASFLLALSVMRNTLVNELFRKMQLADYRGNGTARRQHAKRLSDVLKGTFATDLIWHTYEPCSDH